MLSGEQRERARDRWTDIFEKVYSKDTSIFHHGTELIVVNVETMKCYGEDGLEYTLQVAPWENEADEDCISRAEVFSVIDSCQDLNDKGKYNTLAEVMEKVLKLPSVVPTFGVTNRE